MTRKHSKNSAKKPTGAETMKRRTPKDLSLLPQKSESDPKKAYSKCQLAEIGSIALKWNQIEAHIDFIGSYILFAKTPFWLKLAVDKEIRTKVKLKLLRQCVAEAELFDKKAQKCIHDCFSEVDQCRIYRNAIIHHHIYDHEKGIGSYVDDAHSSHQILVSLDALRTLYEIMSLLLEELREIDLLFRLEVGAQPCGRMNLETQEFEPFTSDVLRSQIVPEHTARIARLQNIRRNLPGLPTFPDAALVRAYNHISDT